jgi:hypothetical protein
MPTLRSRQPNVPANPSGWYVIEEQAFSGSSYPDFQSISGAYRALQVLFFGASATVVDADPLYLRFNNDSGNNYVYQRLGGTNASAFADAQLTQSAMFLGYLPGTNAPANSCGVGEIMLPGYANTTFHKQMISAEGFRYGAGVGQQQTERNTGTWLSTAAITRIQLVGGNWVTGSKAVLLGLT